MVAPATCGKGLAENSVLPRKIAELIAALAAILEGHIPSLDRTDENAGEERGAYVKLAQRHRAIAAQLESAADEMASYRDLPVARHDQTALSSAEVLKTFADFVTAEQKLLALLQSSVARDRDMLDQMGQVARSHDA